MKRRHQEILPESLAASTKTEGKEEAVVVESMNSIQQDADLAYRFAVNLVYGRGAKKQEDYNFWLDIVGTLDDDRIIAKMDRLGPGWRKALRSMKP